MERAAGIEPATLAWKARALPLCNARELRPFLPSRVAGLRLLDPRRPLCGADERRVDQGADRLFGRHQPIEVPEALDLLERCRVDRSVFTGIRRRRNGRDEM